LLSSEDDEDEEEEAPVEKAEGEEDVEATEKPVKKRKNNDTTELVEYSPDELREVDKEMLNAEITQLEGTLSINSTTRDTDTLFAEDTARAKPNLNVLAEYRKREAEFLDRAKDMESVTGARDNAKKRYDDLRKVRLEEFMAGFSAISSKLKEMYQVRLD
jgi:structural maintenance of chromosome 4